MRLFLCLAGLALAGCHAETVRTPIGPSLPVEPTLNAASAGYDEGCACDRQAAAPPLVRPAVTLEHPPGTQIAPPRPEPPVEVQAAQQPTTRRSAVPFPVVVVVPPVSNGSRPDHGPGRDRGPPLPPPPKPEPKTPPPPPPPTWVIKAGSSSHGAPARPSAPAPQGSATR